MPGGTNLRQMEGRVKTPPRAERVPEDPRERSRWMEAQAERVRADMEKMTDRLGKQTGPYPPGDADSY